MQIPFSKKPGRHERHFKRRLNNPLMPRPLPGDYDKEDLLEVQRLDHEELLQFLGELRETVRQAVELQPREESQVVLDLKAAMEKLYETACGLADAQGNNKSAIRQLIAVIMDRIRQGAEGDELAAQELAQEESARISHFHLLETDLIADLLHPQSLIVADELAAVLLTDPEQEVAEAMSLFDDEQRQLICDDAESLLGETGLKEGYQQRMELLQMGRLPVDRPPKPASLRAVSLSELPKGVPVKL